ncbi:MAG: ATPase, T2SS/T4P/T4SS family [Planctomycetota bacterium]
MSPGAPKRVGEALIEMGELTEEQLSVALDEQRQTGKKLGEILVAQGVITAESLTRAVAYIRGVPGVRLRHGLFDPSILDLVGKSEGVRLGCLPLFAVRGELTIAMSRPDDLPTIDRLTEITGMKIRPVFALEANIAEFISKQSDSRTDIDEFLTTITEADLDVIEREAIDEERAADLEQNVDGSPIVNLVNLAVLTAVRTGASDIHIEPSEKGTRIRSRVDGVLRDLMRPPLGMHAAIVSRIKVIGKMDIAQKRLPQEGRVRTVAEGREIDLRVSSMPTLLGEKMVIRILDKKSLNVRMSKLGFREESLTRFTKALKLPNGLVLVTGPTGSGKTTTLYSALDLLRSPERNIVTVEDPVEYQLDLINQIQVHDQVGLSFARALRSILRQDPDIIMIGEIRDEDTASVAVQAALTGHTVLATLHTNDAAGTISRMRDMGVPSYLLSSALNFIVAQRLARKNCPDCLTQYFPTDEMLEEAGIPEMSGVPFRRGEGCGRCHDSGHEGRLGIYETLEVRSNIRRLIYADSDASVIRSVQRSNGNRLLREEAVLHAIEGNTSLDEALRVTRSEDFETEEGSPAAAAA